jgi:hypothetical protein
MIEHNAALSLSLETICSCSKLLGHSLEDRSAIRGQQDWSLVRSWQARTSTVLRNREQEDLFAVAPLDLLVSDLGQKRKFHLLELNGTGIGGLTNMSSPAINAVLQCMRDMAIKQSVHHERPTILIASSGKESESKPRLNRLIYEKMLYADAFRAGLLAAGRKVDVQVASSLTDSPESASSNDAMVVVGYIKELIDLLSLSDEGNLMLGNRRVTGLVNDRFCLNVLSAFGHRVDLSQIDTMNRCHLAGADKGVAYSLLNDFLQREHYPFFPDQVRHEIANTREELVRIVLDWRKQGLMPLIKPQGTGLGHGIEFFLHDEPESCTVERIDRSIELTKELYGFESGAFPYTVCEYVDACAVPDCTHPLYGHKYELRVVVYRDGRYLKAFPSIIKVAADTYCPDSDSAAGLINNITASCTRENAKGTDFMFPLANQKTLDLFQIEEQEILSLCNACTQYVRFVLDQTQDNPSRLGLPQCSRVGYEEDTLAVASPEIGSALGGVTQSWALSDLLSPLRY